MKITQTPEDLKSPANASQVRGTEAEILNATSSGLSGLRTSGNPDERLRVSGSRPNVGTKNRDHPVFVLSSEGKPLTPTTPGRARRLLSAGVAKPFWSRFNTFGIQLLVTVRDKGPRTCLGIDTGTKFEGYSLVCGTENNLSVKLDLPDKKHIVRKITERRLLRRARRFRNCRRRPARFDNRKRVGFLAPSQSVIVGSRLKMIREMFRLYPIGFVALEDVRFNHARHRWGANFSTAEYGKTRLREFIAAQGARLCEYRGFETEEIRKRYGYRKTKVKNADKFTAHCSDSLAIAVETIVGERVEPGRFIVVDDSYRPVRRRLHYMQASKDGVRSNYSRGTVRGLRKGILVGIKGRIGRLCGDLKSGYRYYARGTRQTAVNLDWACGHFVTRNPIEGGCPK